MNRLTYLVTSLRLRLTARRALAAKNNLTFAIHKGRKGTERMDDAYEQFLTLSEKQEILAVKLRRMRRRKTDRPILKSRLNLQDVTLSPSAKDALTAFDLRLALARHKCCDWGEIPTADWQYNNDAVKYGSGKILARYPYHGAGCFLIETNLKTNTSRIRLEGEEKCSIH